MTYFSVETVRLVVSPGENNTFDWKVFERYLSGRASWWCDRDAGNLVKQSRAAILILFVLIIVRYKIDEISLKFSSSNPERCDLLKYLSNQKHQ